MEMVRDPRVGTGACSERAALAKNRNIPPREPVEERRERQLAIAHRGLSPFKLAAGWGVKETSHTATTGSHSKCPKLESLEVRNAQAGNEMQLIKDIKGNGKNSSNM